MNKPQCVVLLVLILGIGGPGNAVGASRINRASISAHTAAEGGSVCVLKESDQALGYGLSGKFMGSCPLKCKWNTFFIETFPEKVMIDPDVSEDGESCKCNYAPRYWESAGSKKFWFQFRINPRSPCTQKSCQDVFFTWGNQFLKKWHYPGDNERMPVAKRLESQENYELECTNDIPEAIVLPSPGSKITELRLLIAKTTDPDEKARLQALLDELLGDKVVEVFEYDLEADWVPTEHHADASNGGDVHTYYLKPCKSNLGKEVTELHDIVELCGPGEMGTSMKEGKLRYSYKTDKDWGPEQVCTIDAEKCKILEDEVAKDGWKLLSFRLKPCGTPSQEQELTDLSKVLADEGCGAPTLGLSLLPVKVSASHKFDQDAPEDELEFPCP